jgi:hypothetical protein
MSNYSILQQNTLDGLPSEEAKSIYLRGCSRNERQAFWAACQWEESLKPFLDKFLQMASEPFSGCVPDGLREFFLERHFRTYFPQGRDR